MDQLSNFVTDSPVSAMRFTYRRRIIPQTAPNQYAIYHCVSRVVDKRFIFGPKEKTQFLVFLRRYERFCRVRILGYCLMDNHFHLLVHVQGRPEARPSQDELMDHVRATLGPVIASQYQSRLDFWQDQLSAAQTGEPAANVVPSEIFLSPGEDLAAHARAQLEKVSQDIWQRMYDLSRFILSVKQRFSHWFNQTTDRNGTLWEDRFQAVLVQPGAAVAELAAYIDLNPVRAGIVGDAKDYPWSQFGAAVAGDGLAQQALEYLVEHHALQQRARAPIPNEPSPGAPLMGLALGLATMHLFLQERDKRRRATQNRRELEASASSPPVISYAEDAVPAFSKGLAIGDPDYLEAVFAEHRKHFGYRRQAGAKRILWPRGKGDRGGAVFGKGSPGIGLVALREIKGRKPRVGETGGKRESVEIGQ